MTLQQLRTGVVVAVLAGVASVGGGLLPVYADSPSEVTSLAQAYKYHEDGEAFFPYLFKVIFTPRYFEPHYVHFVDDPELLWFLVASHALISLSYLLIPAALLYFLWRRKDVFFSSIFWLFAAFIVLCGMTHLMHIIIFWYPIYWLEGIILFMTALVSIGTFFALLPVLPKAITLRSTAELESVNEKLLKEVEARKEAEQHLRDNEEALKRGNAQLQAALEEMKEGREELERINELLVGRELRMKELKEELDKLKKQT